ncbi:MAG: hypothetical protein KIT31_16150, partial [Deltaproteobacteria bacterium]|nr:hypothetical protein [Deltaproteobacteria bacterium]
LRLALDRRAAAYHATCEVAQSGDSFVALRQPARARTHQRIRVVSAPLGVAADDAGELVVGQRIVRFRPKAAALDLGHLAPGLYAASTVQVAPDVALEVQDQPRGVALRGAAELFVASAGESEALRAWQRLSYASTLALDRVTLIVAGPPERRVVALYRPPRAWGGSTTIDTLLADDTVRAGDARTRRAYPYGDAVPELGWINPFDAAHSMGLDGWIHAAHASTAAATPACGTLAPPEIARDRVCTRNPLDGVLECRVSLQPELAIRLRSLAERILADPKTYTARDVTPVRAAYVVLRGDTGELLAQGNLVPGRPRLAYAPVDEAAEAALVELRDRRAEQDAERIDWNLPIAIGSTFKPIVARAAEQAFPAQIAALGLTAEGHGGGCKGKRAVDPFLGHCPPTPVTGQPAAADFHDFLARSPNWYMAALGMLGLGLPDGTFTVDKKRVTLADITSTDLASWPADKPLEIADATGPILTARTVNVDGVRRTKLWSRIEAFLGRPLCTLGDRAQCERAAARADVCSARALPIASPTSDLRYLVSLGPDRIDLYAGDRAGQAGVPVREYFQLLRGSGLHAVGSLAQITDAFGRVVYDPAPGAPTLAATWFPSPAAGTLPDWTCAATGRGHAASVRGPDGGLCAVLQPGGTANTLLGDIVDDPAIRLYGAKTGTIDSLAEIARRPAACRAWNASHVPAAQLACGKVPPDDSLFVIAFGVVTPQGTIPVTLGIQLQRAGKGAATRATPHFIRAIATYLRG